MCHLKSDGTGGPLQDVMKRKAIEIEKNKMERARDGKAGVSTYVPSSISSISVSGNRSGADQDATPTYSRCANFSLALAHIWISLHGCEDGKMHK